MLATRLVEIYKDDEPDILTVILESDGFADMLDRTAFLERISEQDRAIVTRVRVLKKETTEARPTSSPSSRSRSRTRPTRSSPRRTRSPQARAQLVERQGALADARAERRTVLARCASDRTRLEGDLEELEARAGGGAGAHPRGAGRGRAVGGGGGRRRRRGPIKRGSGGLIWPVNGPVVVRLRPALGTAARGQSTSRCRSARPCARRSRAA